MKKKRNTSPMRKLIPAAGMLAVSAMMLASSTYAWFTMNKEVEVTNMQVRAVAEDGLLINEVATADDSHWDDEATAKQTSSNPCLLYPASTADGSTWYHAASKKSYDAAAASAGSASTDLVNGYETLSSLTAITSMSVTTATAGDEAARSVMGSSATAAAGYYVHYTYYLKGASGNAVTLGTNADDMNVYIKSVTATPATAAGSGSGDLDKSLRVGILMKASGTFYIYAPVSGYTSSYYVNASSTATAPIAGNTATATDLTSLPAVGSAGTPVEVYLWYEGEDANCKSDNALATTLDNIDVDIKFELKAVPST
jgi:DNA uptake protein ComE-like DNA-binding protein